MKGKNNKNNKKKEVNIIKCPRLLKFQNQGLFVISSSLKQYKPKHQASAETGVSI